MKMTGTPTFIHISFPELYSTKTIVEWMKQTELWGHKKLDHAFWGPYIEW